MSIERQLKSLKVLAKELNDANVKWSLGASLMLNLRGYDCTVDDIDIVVDENSYDELMILLKKYPYTYMESNPKYQTKHFFSLEIEGVDIDIMVDFRVKHEGGLYVYPFHIDKEISIEGEIVYLSSVEEWLEAYKAMGRDQKIKLIEQTKKV